MRSLPSTVADTSGSEPKPRVTREIQRFGRIVVVGGGCYGSYYVRQLGRAHAAGAAEWSELIVVDSSAQCRVARAVHDGGAPSLRLEIASWSEFFHAFLSAAAAQPDLATRDAIVPSPLMPHLMADWIVARMKARWPDRSVTVLPLASEPKVPWQRAAGDTHYVSFAEWMCPINCIEPQRCPATRGPRDWSMPVAIRRYASDERAAGRKLDGAYTFHCGHRTHGVGMIDVAEVLRAEADIAIRSVAGPGEFVLGTASHCHGALRRVAIGA